jgi:hypothetical protein
MRDAFLEFYALILAYNHEHLNKSMPLDFKKALSKDIKRE